MIQTETVIGRKEYFNWRRGLINSSWVTDENGVVHIPLAPYKHGIETIIDSADKDIAYRFTWRVRFHSKLKTKFYAEAFRPEDDLICAGQKRTVSLHRLLLGFPDGLHVDHINGNGLDNRRCNLRPATPSQNCSNRAYKNKTGYRGVVKSKRGRGYIAQCTHDGKNRHIGYFQSPEAAALAYNHYAEQQFGEFAVLNEVTVNG